MDGRVGRWVVSGLGLGVLPLVLAYVVHAYYRQRAPGAADLLAGGEGLLVAVAWAAAAIVELLDTRPGRMAVRLACATVAGLVVLVSTVAYACLTADSVTGRVQTRWQAQFVTAWSVCGLATAAVVSTATVALGRRGEESR